MSDYEKRLEVAQELAAKDGQDWETLDEVMHNAYLHNADGAIAERSQVAEGKEPGAPVIYVCDVCKDEAYIGGKPCYDCNPRGLTKEEVHPAKLIIPEALPDKTIKETADIAREILAEAPAEEKPEPPEPKPGQYLCAKCNVPHRVSSKIGTKHLKYLPKVEG